MEAPGGKKRCYFLSFLAFIILGFFFTILLSSPIPAFAATTTLNSNASGTYAQWTWSGGSANFTNWQSDDADTTYASTTARNNNQTVNLDDTSLLGSINSVIVYAKARQTTGNELIRLIVRTNAIDYFSASTGVVATTYTQYSNTWTTNPNTGAAWTWSEVNALEAGVRSIRNGGTWTGEMRATKVWVVVDYVDSQAPTTIISATPSAPNGLNGWFVSIPSITLTPDEAATTYYSWVSSTGPWTTYASPFNAPTGETTLYYYSVDSSSNTEAVKSQLFKVDTGAPSSTMSSPSEGAKLNGSSYNITGTSSDPASSGVAKVEVSVNGGVFNLATGTTSWSYSWTLPSDGSYNIKSRATDNAGNVETPGAGVNVSVDNTVPTVSITNPTNGAMIKGTINVAATASDNVGVTKVEFYLDEALVFSDISSPYEYVWDTSFYLDGLHSLKAIAYDGAGNTGQDVISVTVDNTAPLISGTTGNTTAAIGEDKAISINVTDNISISSVTLSYRNLGSLIFTSLFMTNLGGNTYQAIIPAVKVTETDIEYYIEASDGLANTSTDPIGAPILGTYLIETRDLTMPTTPTDLLATVASASQIDLSWTASSDNVGVVGYKIERSTDGLNFSQIATTPSTGYSDTGLAASTTYYYRVRAYDGAGNNSGYSNVASGATPDIEAPVVLITSPAEGARVRGMVNITATASDNVGITKVEFYLDTILKSTDITLPYEYPLDSTTLADGIHTIRATAYDAANNSSSDSITIIVDNTPPTVISTEPTDGATGIAATTAIEATFSEGMDASTLGASTFTLKDSLNNSVPGTVSYDSPSQIATFIPTASLAFETTYTATISGEVKDLAGNPMTMSKVWSFTTQSGESISGEIGPAGGILETPNGEASLDIPQAALSTTETISINLSSNNYPLPSGLYNYSSHYDFGADGLTFASPVTVIIKYKAEADPSTINIYWYNILTSFWEKITSGRMLDLVNQKISVTTTHLTDFAILSLDTTPPTNPTLLSASLASSAQINLYWTASTDNVGVAGYEIERSPDGTTNWTKIGISVVTYYADPALSPSTTYYYRVRAYDAAGNYSNYSQLASATTYAITAQPPKIPHSGYSSTTNTCLQCHDVHQAAGEYALTRWATVTDTCGSCHNLYLSPPGTLPGYANKSPATPPGSYSEPGVEPAYYPGYGGSVATPGQASSLTAYKVTWSERAAHEGHRLGLGSGQVLFADGIISNGNYIPGGTESLTRIVSSIFDTTELATSISPIALYNTDPWTTALSGTDGLYCADCHTPHGEFGYSLPWNMTNGNLLSSRPNHRILPTITGAITTTGQVEIWDPRNPYNTIGDRNDVSDWIYEGGKWCAQCHDKRLFGQADLNGAYHNNHPDFVCLNCHDDYRGSQVPQTSDFPHTGVRNILAAYPDELCLQCHKAGSLP